MSLLVSSLSVFSECLCITSHRVLRLEGGVNLGSRGCLVRTFFFNRPWGISLCLFLRGIVGGVGGEGDESEGKSWRRGLGEGKSI